MAECMLQLRLLNGQTIKQPFKETDTIQTVYEYVNAHHNKEGKPFRLQNSYPRTIFAEDKLHFTIIKAGLAKGATLIVTTPNAQQAHKTRNLDDPKNKGFFTNLFSKNRENETEAQEKKPREVVVSSKTDSKKKKLQMKKWKG